MFGQPHAFKAPFQYFAVCKVNGLPEYIRTGLLWFAVNRGEEVPMEPLQSRCVYTFHKNSFMTVLIIRFSGKVRLFGVESDGGNIP